MKAILKITSFLFIAFLLKSNVSAQLTVASNGYTSINANIGSWASGLRVTVPLANACAYHLTLSGVGDTYYVTGEGLACAKKGFWNFSDIKYKEKVNKINSPLSLVQKLNGVQFNYKGDNDSDGQRIGFIAQDVETVIPGIVRTMNDSDKVVSYIDIIPLLVEAIKEQQTQIDNLSKQSSKLKSAYTQTGVESIESIALAYLDQNAPNPFSQTTQIGYYLPDAVQKATLYVYDMNGTQLKTIPINQKGKGSITISGSELRPGMYLYTLIADGKEIDTKRMILTE